MNGLVRLMALVAIVLVPVAAVAQDVVCNGEFCSTGARAFAGQLNSGGGLYHDPGFVGAEVVYRSSGPASPAAAHAAWQRSPGHRRLVNSGAITDVQCVGNVCVGRGSGVQSATAVARSEHGIVRSRVTVRSGGGRVARAVQGVRQVAQAVRPRNVISRVRAKRC